MPRDLQQKQAFLARWGLGCILFAFLAVLICVSLRLAAMRSFHPDECYNGMMARQAGAGRDLFQLLLTPMVGNATRSIDILTSARFFMLEIFWLNIVLIAVATGERLFSMRGLVALAAAATLVPLWDWGFEIRRENVALSLIMLGWCALQKTLRGLESSQMAPSTQLKSDVNERAGAMHRVWPAPTHIPTNEGAGNSAKPALVLGALAGMAQLITPEAVLFTAPLAALMLALEHSARHSRWKLVFAWLGGAVSAVAAVSLVCGILRVKGGYGLPLSLTSNSGWQGGFGLSGLPPQLPLLMAVAFAAALVAGPELRRIEAARVWLSRFPEFLLLGGALAVLAIHPTRLSAMTAVAFGFVAGLRYLVRLWKEFGESLAWVYAAAGLIIFAHLTPFGLATLRNLNYSNARQEGLMRVAENLTDPSRDLVLGGVGMVATRRTAELHRASLNQSLTMTSTPVFIRTSQSDELRKEESVFMKANYLPLADDCWILGRLLPKGGGEFELLHPGRYRISSLEGSDLAGTYPEGFKGLITPEVEGRIEGTLDGVTLRTEVVELLAGKHRLECPSKCVPIVLWVGPKLNRIHKIGSGDHRYLFVQAY